MRERRLLLMDLGKVLVDIDFSRFRERMTARTGLTAERLREAIMGDNLAVRFESGEMTDREFHAVACRRMGVDVEWEEFVDSWNSIFLPDPILPDSLLESLSAKSDIWAISNTNKIHFEFIAAKYSFMRFFQGCVVSFEAGSVKPDARIFLHALEAARASPQDAVFVDDQALNVEAACHLGIAAFKFEDPDQFVREARARGLL